MTYLMFFQIVDDMMFLKCRCHGVSGSCAFRTCWKSLPKFREIGDKLRDQYIDSKKVKQAVRSRREAKIQTTFNTDNTDLVFLSKSPDYCRSNSTLGILGTKGRVCALNNQPKRRCKFLCCGRGYRLKVFSDYFPNVQSLG